ncbi:outer membrane protein assembly factor BamE [Pseudomonas sp. R1-18]|uniref:outer membrane protein assembly factor BamE domain-containing protein n=1 Tax=Pseudomonas sp. R1-18 TaxID=1632772 RepID=UPI003DA99638
MPPPYPFSLGCAVMVFSTLATASSVQRCEDNAGNITFTTLGCPADHSSETRKVSSPPPGSVAPLLPQAQTTQRGSRDSVGEEVVIVGQRDDGCGNRLTAEQRRQAIINQRTPPGMTRRDVESLLGRPDKVVNRNGELRYVYKEKKGRTNTVTFDAEGCVKGKR